eukprot:COSAG06_NODE_5692_length_3317_cov_100.038222_2_plen_72_part_00
MVQAPTKALRNRIVFSSECVPFSRQLSERFTSYHARLSIRSCIARSYAQCFCERSISFLNFSVMIVPSLSW